MSITRQAISVVLALTLVAVGVIISVLEFHAVSPIPKTLWWLGPGLLITGGAVWVVSDFMVREPKP